jgi:hypothetical protein
MHDDTFINDQHKTPLKKIIHGTQKNATAMTCLVTTFYIRRPGMHNNLGITHNALDRFDWTVHTYNYG